jgi:hypothetical protein
MLIYFTVGIYKEDISWGGSINALVCGSGKSPVLIIDNKLDARIVLTDMFYCSVSGCIIYKD